MTLMSIVAAVGVVSSVAAVTSDTDLPLRLPPLNELGVLERPMGSCCTEYDRCCNILRLLEQWYDEPFKLPKKKMIFLITAINPEMIFLLIVKIKGHVNSFKHFHQPFNQKTV
jgi:hypothetical protein